MNKILLLTHVFCISFLCNAQIKLKPKDVLLSYINEVGNFKQPKSDSVYFMNLEIITVMKGVESKPITMNISTYLSKQLSFFDNELVTVVQDDEFCYYISKKDRKIYKRKASDFSEEKFNSTLKMQKYFIESSEFIMEKKLENKVFQGIEYLFKTSEYIRNSNGISDVSYVYNYDMNMIESQVLKYVKNNKIDKQIINYKTIDFNYKGKYPKGNAEAYIYQKNGMLKREYFGYKIINMIK